MTYIRYEPQADFTKITLDRPEKLNAFFGTMREELVAALDRAASDEPRVVVITGAGRGFCAGGDVEYMSRLQKERNREAFEALLDAGAAITARIRQMPKFVIAAVNGVAAGAGCNLALACDYRIAAESAKFGETFVRIGLHPDWGGTWFLPRLVGTSRAMEMLMSGRMVDAREAFSIGLVDQTVADDQLPQAVADLALTIAAGPPLPIARIKAAVYAAASNDLDAQLDLEKRNQIEAFLSSDSAEGMAAFFEKRKPQFRGE